MCGIIGYIGVNPASPILLDGLRRLEYRGYDSAGIAVADSEGNIVVSKAAGKLNILVQSLNNVLPPGNCGIGHTVEKNVSFVSKISGVREAMVEHQRRIAHTTQLVVAGRDIGTVVFPDAPLKIFLTASVSERARRRFQELQSGGNDIAYSAVLQGLGQRDKLDSQRKVAPLRPAPDAYIITTNGLDIEQVIDQIMRLAVEAL